MAMITAIYEHGVFRPLGLVDLPEGSTVRIQPVATLPSEPRTPEEEAHLDRIYEIRSRRHHGGDSQATARHNEHHP